MGERPSYRPWLWGMRWPLVARWAKDRPDRVIAWYGGSLLAIVAVLATAAVFGWRPVGGAGRRHALVRCDRCRRPCAASAACHAEPRTGIKLRHHPAVGSGSV